MRNPEDQRGMSRSANKELGGEVIGHRDFTGSYETYATIQLPSNVGTLAVPTKLFCSGVFGELTRTAVLTVEKMKAAAALIDKTPTLHNFHSPSERASA